MAKTQYLQYTIQLTDRALVKTLQGAVGVGGVVGAVILAPDTAAITYSAPIKIRPTPALSPCIVSEWFGTSDHFPTNVATFDRKSGGLFGIPLLFGTTTHYYWRGLFEYVPAVATDPDTGTVGAPSPISQRRWIDGFEYPTNGEGSTGAGGGTETARVASRHTDGYGFAMRSSQNVRSHIVDQYAVGITPASSWERFYVRRRNAPGTSTAIWRCRGSVENATGLQLAVTPSGQLALNQMSNTSVASLLGTTSVLTLHKWYRVDVLVRFGGGVSSIYLDGVLALSGTPAAVGMGTGGRTHASSEVGDTVVNTLAADIDDWMCADIPPILNGLDWLNGSRVVPVQAKGFGATNDASWAASDWRILLQNPVSNLDNFLASAVSAARLVVTTDYANSVAARRGVIPGIVAMLVMLNNSRVAVNGTLGWRLAGVDTLAAITQGGTQLWQSVMLRPLALAAPQDLTGLELVHVHGASATGSSVWALAAEAEVLGVFGDEDLVPTTVGGVQPDPPKTTTGIHNAPYPDTPWAFKGTPPTSPVVIKTGTYVGNGTVTELAFRAPVTFFHARPVTGDAGGVWWWSSLVGAHKGLVESTDASMLVQALRDPDFVPVAGVDQQQEQYLIRLPGSNTQNNAVGVTYSYVAYCDPGMRFSLAGSLTDFRGATDIITTLVDTLFNAVAGWFAQEALTTSATARMFYKGPGHTATSISNLTAAETAAALQLAAGQITSKSVMHSATWNQLSFLLFRKDDGSTDAGVAKVVQIGSYTGDGAASRTLALTPASGLRPMWAIVIPHNAAAVMRDISHTTVTSTTLPSTANASTGITGADIDSLSVGSALNAIGIVYDYFVFPGCTGAGNGGFSGACENIPVDPEPPVPPSGPWDPYPAEPSFPPDTPVDDPDAPQVPPDIGDLDTQCLVQVTKLCNMALSRIGQTVQIADILTENSAPAMLGRLHYTEELDATLRAFPWPFATKYAALTLQAGTDTVPVNNDWQYAYRVPADAVFSRRLVNEATRRSYDVTPLLFRLTSDANGNLLYTDEQDAYLEYTYRPVCAALRGDALFRTALVWRLAAAFAPGLSRDSKTVQFCLAMFERTIQTAEVAAANEVQQDKPGDAEWIAGRN